MLTSFYLDGPPEDVKGTHLYLEVCWRYANIFLSPSTDLLAKVKDAACVCNFVRIWRNYAIRSKEDIRRCMLSREAVIDIILSCQAVVLYIMRIRDLCPGHPIELGLTGTDCCESYFSENGSFVMNHHTYSFNDLLGATSKMITINLICSRDNIAVTKAHSKQESIWHRGHPEMFADGQQAARDPPTNDELVQAWHDGEDCARRLWKSVGVDSSDDWFMRPHLQDCKRDVPLTAFWSDPDSNVISEQEYSEVSDDIEVDSHIRQVLEQEALPTIQVPGVGRVYKATVVTLLNSDPNISKDRLLRVQANNARPPADSSLPSDNSISLFSDMLARHAGKFIIGRVQRIISLANTTRVEWTQPVQLPCQLTNVEVVLNIYKPLEGESSEFPCFHWQYTQTSKTLPAASFIESLELTYAIDDHTYTLSEAQFARLKDLNLCYVRRRRQNDNSAAAAPTNIRAVEMSSPFGRAVFEVPPSPQSRSQRLRRVVTYID